VFLWLDSDTIKHTEAALDEAQSVNHPNADLCEALLSSGWWSKQLFSLDAIHPKHINTHTHASSAAFNPRPLTPTHILNSGKYLPLALASTGHSAFTRKRPDTTETL